MKKVLPTVLTLALMSGVISAHAADPVNANAITLAKDDAGRVLLTWEEFKQVTHWAEGRGQKGPKNGEFVIPWAEVQQLLGVKIKDVGTAELKLPWKEFKTLLEWSVKEGLKDKDKADEDPVPVPYLISSSQYVGTGLSKEGAQFTGAFKVEVLEKKGWKKIPILPATVAVSEAKLPDGVFLIQEAGTYQLMTQASGSYDIEIQFSVAATETGGSHVLTFNKVATGSSVLDVTIPETDVDVTITGAQSTLKKKVADGTRVVAALPSTMPVYVKWERSIAEAKVVPPKLYSETRTLVSVADGLFLGHAQISYSVLHTPTRQFDLNLPVGVSVLDVTGRDMRDWRVEKNTLTVLLERDVIGAYMLDVKYEASRVAGAKKVTVPVITAKGVEREKGHVGIVALTNVEVKSAEATGANLIDVKGLPAAIPSMTTQPVLLAYRYVDPEFGISLEISKHMDVGVLLTVIDTARVTSMQTIDGRRITRVVYDVRNNRNQFLRLKMPEGAELWSVTVAGKATQPASDKEGRILLPLVRSQGSGGLSSFPVELVYAEQGSVPSSKGAGKDMIELPASSEPIMHVTMSLYLPRGGKYRNFGGSLRSVENFRVLTRAQAQNRSVQQVAPNANVMMQQGQQDFSNIAQPGADAVTVKLPLNGTILKFEKLLALQDAQSVSFEYSNLKR